MTTKTAPTKFEQTHVCLVLDRSGSMDSCRDLTIDTVNKYLKEARGDAALMECDFELTIFDSQSIDTIRTGAPVKLADISREDYIPRGGTPLFDAIGRGIDTLDAKLAKAGTGKAVLVITTDGQENASRKYTHGSISELLKARQDAGWLVVFLGAGLDAARQGIQLGINVGTVASFDSCSTQSMDSVAENVYSASRGYASNRTAGEAKQWMKAGAANFSMSARKAMGDTTGGGGLQALKVPPAPKSTPKPLAGAPAAGSQGKPHTTDSWEKGASGDAWGK